MGISKPPFCLCFLSRSGDPCHGASAHQDGVDAQPIGAQSNHGIGGGGTRPPAADHQRGPHRLSNVRHQSQHGPQDHLLWEQVGSERQRTKSHKSKLNCRSGVFFWLISALIFFFLFLHVLHVFKITVLSCFFVILLFVHGYMNTYLLFIFV